MLANLPEWENARSCVPSIGLHITVSGFSKVALQASPGWRRSPSFCLGGNRKKTGSPHLKRTPLNLHIYTKRPGLLFLLRQKRHLYRFAGTRINACAAFEALIEIRAELGMPRVDGHLARIAAFSAFRPVSFEVFFLIDRRTKRSAVQQTHEAHERRKRANLRAPLAVGRR